MSAGTQKLYYLEGVRGIASFLVFLHHFLLVFYTAYYNWMVCDTHLGCWDIRYGQSVFSFLTNGNFHVDIFFVLSGFVLSRKYFQTNDLSIVISGAYKRFIRIYVPVAFALIVAYILLEARLYFNTGVAAIAHSSWWFGNMWTFPHPFAKLCQSLAYSTMFMGDGSLDTTLWTMSLELFGSYFIFSFLALTHGTTKRGMLLLAVLAYFLVTDQSRFCCFALGISLNYLERLLAKRKSVSSLLALLLLIVGLALGSYPPNDPVKGTLFFNLPSKLWQYSGWFNVAGSYLLLTAVMMSKHLQRFFSAAIFRFLAFISFSLYLLHPLVLGSVSSYAFLRLYPGMGYNPTVIAVFVITTAVCMGLSWVMAKYIDANGIRLADWFYLKSEGKTDKKTIY